MKKKQWIKIEPILDRALTLSNKKEREDFVRKESENESIQKKVLELLEAIQKAEEKRFME